jgi:hypothetical protein
MDDAVPLTPADPWVASYLAQRLLLAARPEPISRLVSDG